MQEHDFWSFFCIILAEFWLIFDASTKILIYMKAHYYKAILNLINGNLIPCHPGRTMRKSWLYRRRLPDVCPCELRKYKFSINSGINVRTSKKRSGCQGVKVNKKIRKLSITFELWFYEDLLVHSNICNWKINNEKFSLQSWLLRQCSLIRT